MKKKIPSNKAKYRLDQYLQTVLKDLSRTQIQSIITNNQVKVNNEPVKKNYRLELADIVDIELKPKTTIVKLEPIKEDIDIVHQDTDIIIINKPPFLPVHPDHKLSHPKTLVNLLLGNKIALSDLGGENRPGIVHRLDMDTSGLIIIAKTDTAYKHFRHLFEDRQITKKYICLVEGEMQSKKGLIRAPITRSSIDRKKMSVQATQNAKNALSEFKVLETIYWKEAEKFLSLVEVNILTGRTHQIRVHFSSIQHPLIGDTTYGNSNLNKTANLHGLKRQFLHASKLNFKNLDGKPLKISSTLPKDLSDFLENCKK
jgi:23S rRNA pseudouridine1911/1915/1917 synthase